jgi:hypothetical protein
MFEIYTNIHYFFLGQIFHVRKTELLTLLCLLIGSFQFAFKVVTDLRETWYQHDVTAAQNL